MGEKKNVGLGVVALAVLVAVCSGAALYYAARYVQDEVLGGFTQAELAHEKALELLGNEHLPVGYNAIGYTSGEVDTVYLSTSEPTERLADLEIGDRVFVFSLARDQNENPVSLLEHGSDLFIGEGLVEVPNGIASYESYRGEVPVLDQKQSGIVAELEIRCERDAIVRSAVWLTPDPDSGRLVEELDLQGTAADEVALTSFLGLFGLCPETGDLQEWAELRALAREAVPPPTDETAEDFLKRIQTALRSGVAERVEELHYPRAPVLDGEPAQVSASPLLVADPDRLSIEPLPRGYDPRRQIDGKVYGVVPEPIGLVVIDTLGGERTEVPYGEQDGMLYVCSPDQRTGTALATLQQRREEQLLKISLIGDSTARVRTACRVESATGEVFDETATLNGGALSAIRGQRFRACLFRKEAGGDVRIALHEGEKRVFESAELEIGEKVLYPVPKERPLSDESTPVRR